ncbi:MAG: DUF2169 domain-containing protein [Polyangiaceae bacterium]
MKLVVDAPVSASLLRVSRGVQKLAEGYPEAEVIAAAIVVRQRFAWTGEALAPVPPAREDEHIRFGAVDEGEYGELMADEIAPRTGTDVIVLGDAVATEPVVATRVEVKVGPYRAALDVFGDRVWEDGPGGLMPSTPTPFVRMPITWTRAFGGSAPGDYGPMPWHENPAGKGYLLRKKDAPGTALPNIERPPHIAQWNDRPEVAGLGPYPTHWGLRRKHWAEAHADPPRIELHPERGLFDRAHPALSGQRVDPGPMTIAGMTARVWTFDVPACPVTSEVSIGGGSERRPFELEEILVDLRGDARTVDLAWRTMFRYPLYARQVRAARVIPIERSNSR